MKIALIITLFISFWLLRALFYFLRVREIIKLKEKYHNYLGENNYEFMQNKPRILALFKLANLKDFAATHVEPVSFNQGVRHSLSGFDNISSNRMDIIGIIKLRFEEAIGIFKFRMKQSFSPFFWFEFLLKLPEHIFSYINISTSDSLIKIIQILYWIAMVLIGLHSAKVITLF